MESQSVFVRTVAKREGFLTLGNETSPQQAINNIGVSYKNRTLFFTSITSVGSIGATKQLNEDIKLPVGISLLCTWLKLYGGDAHKRKRGVCIMLESDHLRIKGAAPY